MRLAKQRRDGKRRSHRFGRCAVDSMREAAQAVGEAAHSGQLKRVRFLSNQRSIGRAAGLVGRLRSNWRSQGHGQLESIDTDDGGDGGWGGGDGGDRDGGGEFAGGRATADAERCIRSGVVPELLRIVPWSGW